MSTISGGTETISINVDDYIGQQALLAVEDLCGHLEWYVTQTSVLYVYKDYCLAWAILYDALINFINNLHRIISIG